MIYIRKRVKQQLKTTAKMYQNIREHKYLCSLTFRNWIYYNVRVLHSLRQREHHILLKITMYCMYLFCVHFLFSYKYS